MTVNSIDGIVEFVSINTDREEFEIRQELELYISQLQANAKEKGIKITDYACARAYLVQTYDRYKKLEASFP
ncbi:MAG: hypothetical protein KKD01_19865 [Proteobacteria bacterium]|nr:hypothetical protein [Pseudomonadota bacterium]MBU1456978.1 hypothetical protein [Pseudomonadota bacterium]